MLFLFACIIIENLLTRKKDTGEEEEDTEDEEEDTGEEVENNGDEEGEQGGDEETSFEELFNQWKEFEQDEICIRSAKVNEQLKEVRRYKHSEFQQIKTILPTHIVATNTSDLYENISEIVELDEHDNNNKEIADRLKHLAGYHNRTVRENVIIGDSMLRNIKRKKLANQLHSQKVYVKHHGGAKIGDIKYYAIPTMKHLPNHIIVHVGTNEIRTNKSANDIANSIVKLCIGLKTRDNAVSVSGIIYRGNVDENMKVEEVNELLKLYCKKEELGFIGNSNIPPRLLIDGLHLKNSGNEILFNNFLKCLRN